MEDESFLNPTYGCESDNKTIIELAKKLAGNQQDKKKIVKNFFEFVRDTIEFKVDPVVGALKTLERKSGACLDKSSLLIALCRAAKIPARYVLMTTQILPKKKVDIQELPHVVAEIKIKDQWKILDTTLDQGMKSMFDIPTFEDPKWWKKTSPIMGSVPEIEKSMVDNLNQGYTTDPMAIKLMEIIKQARKSMSCK
ncbi:MAG: transglutaminase-like domain-containing protein [Candidatus Jordarchaeum sp.]|uniref:transglutaminase-like domain-containing protein n=1 Tax=Candidatus Jordarchaeum sp. TaxID=2823881 RepID=UPI004049759D